MAARDNAAPVIIKRKKVVGGDGHHGGAWKVAYADFVTAMMAFFLLMWLLNATTEKQRKGIADYFNPTIPINRISGGGEGAFGGDSVFSEDQIAQTGTGAAGQRPTEERQARGDSGLSEDKAAEDEKAAFEEMARKIEQALQGVGGESMVSEQMARHILTKVTDEGLIVEFFDLEEEPLFVPDTAQPELILEEIAQMLTRVFSYATNGVAINGHTRAYPSMLRQNPVWDLSTERAQTMRGLMEGDGFEAARIHRVSGFADRKPAIESAMSVRNNRLEVILLRNGR
ncbi:chemotaxis protein MotB [Rhodobacter aestuarii]|uniref:Chemotaxis protein MotB n=1 Tax=Rhodobacter aestuarii TaxID=453582 RepID=A0A1N7LJB7_9RHOB|nr:MULTISPECIES: flagellar motor protein MotB [Rhodobacter]PTV95219.1 chemotaxis protein MotB [Rhodobacter aestuarii]SIS73897.1 chemotaxis protein MotB [Rhodobacter aestuarii]SOC07905.1 chemotaxis protein MotB [Rhodobacter sp. JA431]